MVLVELGLTQTIRGNGWHYRALSNQQKMLSEANRDAGDVNERRVIPRQEVEVRTGIHTTLHSNNISLDDQINERTLFYHYNEMGHKPDHRCDMKWVRTLISV